MTEEQVKVWLGKIFGIVMAQLTCITTDFVCIYFVIICFKIIKFIFPLMFEEAYL